jgi:hypothetical protein
LSERQENEDFENEVRRIARALWPEARYSGAVKVDGRERDGVFETEECIHLLEATTSRKQAKAEEDIKKMVKLAERLRRGGTQKAVRCWFVTRDEPLADQRAEADRHRGLVTAIAFAQFQSRLMDVRGYLAVRENYAFGSVRDPVTGGLRPAVGYVPLALAERGKPAIRTPDEVLQFLIDGCRIILLGDYGAGKSMTLQHMYKKLANRYKEGVSPQFPVFLNLRDHYGQIEPAEVLERHARIIGFENPAHLVRAWRAGYVVLLLDGFDEVTGLSIQGLWRKLRDNRYRAMEPVRKLVEQHPVGVGVAITGRAHFFDTEEERRAALGLTSGLEFSLNEFDDAQIQLYLNNRGLGGAVPSWLPSRPLLLAYLASKGLLEDVVGQWAAGLAPAAGWDLLLDKITAREAQIEAGIDGRTVRRILERLATKSRLAPDGLGALGADDIVTAFREVCGYAPDERGMLLLQRLPGLGALQDESETRRFIDESFAETCRAGDVVEFANNPYDTSLFPQQVECAAGHLGVSVAAKRFESLSSSKLTAAIERACSVGNDYVAADLVLAAIEAGHEISSAVYIKNVLLPAADFAARMPNAQAVHFQDCYFGELALDPDVDSASLPRFHSCFIARLEGRVSVLDLPSGVFEDCSFDSFATAAGTTNDVLDLQLPMGVRVLITVLMKLFERRGRGRRENALHRGLDHRARRLVPDVLQLLKAEGLAFPYRAGVETIWIPDRSARARSGKIIASPSAKNDPLLIAAAKLQ